ASEPARRAGTAPHSTLEFEEAGTNVPHAEQATGRPPQSGRDQEPLSRGEAINETRARIGRHISDEGGIQEGLRAWAAAEGRVVSEASTARLDAANPSPFKGDEHVVML